MLRKIRTAVAIVVIAILTFGFLDFSGILNDPWLQKIQFGPALLSLSIVTLVCLIAATLIFGRLYCSVVCPLGIFQDFMNWLSKKVDKKKKILLQDRESLAALGSSCRTDYCLAPGIHFPGESCRAVQCIRTYG